MTTGVEEVMGNEVMAHSNLLRGPGERLAGQEVFLALGARCIRGLSRLSWDTPCCPPPPPHWQAPSARLEGGTAPGETLRKRDCDRGGGRGGRAERWEEKGAGIKEGERGAHLEVGELQVLVGFAALELLEDVTAGLRLSEGGQPLLAAPQALRPPQNPGQEAQLLQRRGRRGRGGGRLPGRAAVAVAERLAVPEQAVQPHADLQVADALGPVLGAVLVQPVAIGRLQRHQLVPREAAEAVALVLRPRRRQQRRQRRHTRG